MATRLVQLPSQQQQQQQQQPQANSATTAKQHHLSEQKLFRFASNPSIKMNSYFVALVVLAAVACAQAGLIAPAHPLAAPLPLAAAPLPLAAPALHAPLLAPALHAPLLAPAPILTAPAVVGHAPVVVGHAPIATSTHIAAPIAAHTISRPVATYSTTHTLLGAPLAAPALLARPALPLAAPAVIAARPALW